MDSQGLTDPSTLPAGPELDRLVAEAIGWDCLEGYPTGEMWACKPGFARRVWRPSRDWNAAMLAAEEFGLFTKHGVSLEQHDCDGKWLVIKNNKIFAESGSGPLAICRAITHIGPVHAGSFPRAKDDEKYKGLTTQPGKFVNFSETELATAWPDDGLTPMPPILDEEPVDLWHFPPTPEIMAHFERLRDQMLQSFQRDLDEREFKDQP